MSPCGVAVTASSSAPSAGLVRGNGPVGDVSVVVVRSLSAFGGVSSVIVASDYSRRRGRLEEERRDRLGDGGREEDRQVRKALDLEVATAALHQLRRLLRMHDVVMGREDGERRNGER